MQGRFLRNVLPMRRMPDPSQSNPNPNPGLAEAGLVGGNFPPRNSSPPTTMYIHRTTEICRLNPADLQRTQSPVQEEPWGLGRGSSFSVPERRLATSTPPRLRCFPLIKVPSQIYVRVLINQMLPAPLSPPHLPCSPPRALLSPSPPVQHVHNKRHRRRPVSLPTVSIPFPLFQP